MVSSTSGEAFLPTRPSCEPPLRRVVLLLTADEGLALALPLLLGPATPSRTDKSPREGAGGADGGRERGAGARIGVELETLDRSADLRPMLCHLGLVVTGVSVKENSDKQLLFGVLQRGDPGIAVVVCLLSSFLSDLRSPSTLFSLLTKYNRSGPALPLLSPRFKHASDIRMGCSSMSDGDSPGLDVTVHACSAAEGLPLGQLRDAVFAHVPWHGERGDVPIY